MKRMKICRCCGQEITVPEEFSRLPLTGMQLAIVVKLYNNMEKFVRHTDFPCTKQSVSPFIRAIRLIFAANNSPWKVVSVWKQGFKLVRTDVQRERAEGSSQGREGSEGRGAATP